MSEIVIKAEPIFHIGSFVVTNSLFLSFLVLLVVCVLVIALRRKTRLVPGRMQNVAEMIMEFFLNLMDTVLGDRKKSEKYLPLVLTIFLFVLFSNWMGLLPGVGSFIFHSGSTDVPLLRSPAADLNFTLALAIIAVLATNFFGIVVLGVFKHFKKFVNFGSPIKFFVGILELLSEVSRVISFSFRLFGNIFAGEVLLAIVFFLVPYIIPVPFLMLEIFFGMIQAFIFAMLTLVFLASHTAKENH